jgi:hypothetical protein
MLFKIQKMKNVFKYKINLKYNFLNYELTKVIHWAVLSSWAQVSGEKGINSTTQRAGDLCLLTFSIFEILYFICA